MKKINEMFKRLAARGERLLIPYITSGDPEVPRLPETWCWKWPARADLIELGIPFSNCWPMVLPSRPCANGP